MKYREYLAWSKNSPENYGYVKVRGSVPLLSAVSLPKWTKGIGCGPIIVETLTTWIRIPHDTQLLKNMKKEKDFY